VVGNSDPMIEAGGASKGHLRCSRMRARPTEGGHVLTTHDPAQRFKGAKRKAALQDDGESAARGSIKGGPA
jgi:hypothetical protein